MKQLLYLHSLARPLILQLAAAVGSFLDSRLRPHLRRLFPSRRAGRIIHVSLLLLGLVVQAVLLWLLSAMITIAIDLAHLWAELASYHFAITQV